MKDSETLHALEYIDADLIEAAEAAPKKHPARPYWFAAIAAVVVLAICIGSVFGGNSAMLVHQVAAAAYPEMAQKPDYPDHLSDDSYYTAYNAWRESQNRQYDQPEGYADSLTDFFYHSMAQFLQGDGNSAYSPVNVYLAMAMLAETTGGNSRQQILDLFGVDTIEQLRQQASHVWNAHYSDDGETTLLLANSLWLDEAYTFHQQTANLLAESYYASSFRGDLGTEALNKALQAWLIDNTGGLLKDQAENVELDPQTVFSLASTVYFTAGWESKFSKSNTKDAVFHLSDSNKTVPFMHKTMIGWSYYWSENFTAIYLELTGNNRMWLILPDEGYTTADILSSDDYLRMTLDPGSWENKGSYQINLSLPKFDVVNQMDLIEGMKAMGVTDIFDHTVSDFTPMTDTPMLYVNQINHAARVSIDEEGCRAAAFTVISVPGAGPPPELDEIDFVLDRPFLFMVSSRDNLPIFAGVVNHP